MTQTAHPDVLALARRIARRYARRGPLLEADELEAAALAALAEAERSRPYDPERGPVDVWAYPYLLRGVVAHLNKVDVLSKRARRTVAVLRVAADALTQRLGRVPTPDEVAAASGVAPRRARALTRAVWARYPRSLDALLEGGEGMLSDEGDGAEAVLDDADRDATRARLDRLLARLDARSRRVVLDRAGGDTLVRIAVRLGLTEARVCQLHAAALDALRAAAQPSARPPSPSVH